MECLKQAKSGAQILLDYCSGALDPAATAEVERHAETCDGCRRMIDAQREVWETLGLPVEQCVEYVDSSPDMREFQSRLFSRIVPTIKNIGLWGPKIRRAYSNMGVMAYADLDSEQLMANDEKVAQEFDARTGRTANA